jgi:aryl-alcohol dehydrogenase
MIHFNAAVVREKGGALIPQVIGLWRQGRFPFDRLIHKYPLAEIEKAAREPETGDVLKAVRIPELA